MRTAGLSRVDVLGALALLALLWVMGSESPVADAAMRGEAEAVRALLKGGADVNAAQGDGMTALHWAAERGDADLAEMLLYAGAETGAVTRVGAYTPLLVAGGAGHAPVMRALLAGGSDPNARTTTGLTALHLAAAAGNRDGIAALLEHGADVDVRDFAAGQTPLVVAASAGRTGAIQLLTRAGADVGVTTFVVDITERETTDRAANRERNERIAALRAVEEVDEESDTTAAEAEAGYPEEAAEEGTGAEEVVAEDEEAADPDEAAENEHEEEVAAGDEAEAESGERAPQPLSYGQLVGAQGGLTALLHAARQGHRDAVMALLGAGADIDQVSDGDRTSPMLIATINGHFDLALELMERGADVNLASDAGTTPLYGAINVQWAPKALYPQPKAHDKQAVTYLEFVERLLEAGADPNLRLSRHLWYMSYNFDLLGVDTKGSTPFWRAAYATDVEAMRLLLAYGADPSVPTQKVAERRRRSDGGKGEDGDPSGLPEIPVGGPGVFPIHAASGVGYGKDFAANSHRHVPDGWLPTVRFLVEELGADIDTRDHEGYTALHHAASRGDVELIRYLVDRGADVTVVSRKGQTTADMANGPVQRVQPFPEAMKLLEELGSENNHTCLSC